MLEIAIAFVKGMRNTLIPVGTFVVGFIIGLMMFGWWLTPVTYIDAGPEDLRAEDHQRLYLRNVAGLYSYDRNADNVRLTFQQWTGALDAICMTAQTEDADNNTLVAQQMRDVAVVLNPDGCAAMTVEEPGGSYWMACLYGLGLLLALGLVGYFWTQRGGGQATEINIPHVTRSTGTPDAGPAVEEGSEEMSGVTPIASFRTTYTHGNSSFDDSFSIETPAGDFLGECGVSISESLSTGSGKAATAMEVWLFDKNDIRTITKVAMSDHAYFDDAIKAKLSPKGEPVLSRPDEVIVLETAALIINARIAQMTYGDSPELPAKSFFDTFGVEISVWAKDDAPTSGGTGLNFDDF